MSDYGLKPYLSKAKTYFDFIREITDQYVNSVGVDTEPGLKRPYMYEDYYSMCYLYDTPIEYLGATPPSAAELGGLTSTEISFAESTYSSAGAVDEYWTGISMSSDGATIVICCTDLYALGDVYKSTDYGVTWTNITPVTGLSYAPWKSVAIDDDGSVIILGNGIYDDPSSRVYVSVNGGASWTTNKSGYAFISVDTDSDGSNLIAGAGAYVNGVFISSDYGASWSTVNADAPTGAWQVASDSTGTNLIAVASYYDPPV